jgi:uncharacterized protein (DUF1330 family)
MLNLLRFKPKVGRERYLEYVSTVAPLVQRHGAEILFAADGKMALAAEAGQAWDAVALVRYPTRRAFADMIGELDYESADHLRMSALEEAVLGSIRYHPEDVSASPGQCSAVG